MSAATLIAFEGLPFTGKSTAAAAVTARRGGVVVVPDYHDMLDPDTAEAMARLSDTAADQDRRVRMYRDLDKQRWVLADRARTDTVIFDRCWVSVEAYRLALAATFPEVGTAVAVSGDNGPVPPLIVYFSVAIATAYDRHRRLARAIDPRMRTPRFLGNLIDAYQHVLAGCGSRVVVVNSDRPLDEVVDHAGRLTREAA